MNIVWEDVENVLFERKASQNEINALRGIYNNFTFQCYLLSEFGILTDKSFFDSSNKKDALEKMS